MSSGDQIRSCVATVHRLPTALDTCLGNPKMDGL